MNLITLDRSSRELREQTPHLRDASTGTHLALLGLEHRANRQQAQAAHRSTAFGAERIAHFLTENLISAADAEHRRARRCALEQHGLDARLAQPLQIGQGVLRARDDDEVRLAQIGSALHITHAHSVDGVERDEVGEVRHLGKPDDGDVDQRLGAAHVQTVGQAVLVVDVEQRIGNHARNG